jgi:hypothetical protein
MTKIKDLQSLDLAIYKLTVDLKEKEASLVDRFEKVSEGFDPGNMINMGLKSVFKGSNVNKTLVSTMASLLVGVLIERVILRKSNVLVKYGIAHIAMNLVSKLADENWQPEFMLRLKDALMKAINMEQQASTSTDQNPSTSHPSKNNDVDFVEHT